MKIKSDNVYALPDGREVVARYNEYDSYCLYDPRLGVAAAPVYWVSSAGRILFWGQPTPWHVDDLQDTGRKSPRQPQILAIA